MKYMKKEMITPILIGGIIGGVLSSIPIIGYLNYCCCLLYVLSGAITAHSMTGKYIPSDRDYMISGALSGVVAGLVNSLLGLLISIVMYGATALFAGDYYFSDYMLMDSLGLVFAILFIPVNILLGAIFGSIGGILYGKLNNK